MLLLNYVTHPHLRKILVEKLADLVREGAERLLQAELRRVYGHAYEHPSSSKSSGSSGSNNRSTQYGTRPKAISDVAPAVVLDSPPTNPGPSSLATLFSIPPSPARCYCTRIVSFALTVVHWQCSSESDADEEEEVTQPIVQLELSVFCDRQSLRVDL